MDWGSQTDVLKALTLLYSLQTEQEKYAHVTVEDNGVGFRADDADYLTSVAEQMLVRGKGSSVKQFTLIQAKLRKYHRQIDEFGFDGVKLPETAIVYEDKNGTEKDGIIRVEGGRLIFKPFVYPTVQIKSIGFRWAQDGSKSWEAPLGISAYENLIKMFPNHTLDTSVTQWLTKLEEVPQLSDDIVKSDLMTFQKEAVGFMLKAERGLLGLAPRLGKTPVSIKAMKEFGGNTLIICPLTLMYNWKREIKTWAGDDAEIWYGHLGRGNSDWIITNYDTALHYMVKYDEKVELKNGKKKKTKVNWRPVEQFGFDNIIIDESVLIKNRNAQRSHTVYTLCTKLKTVKRVFLLSGSPITKFYDDLYFQFHTIAPLRVSSYWKFAGEYCVLEDSPWGTKVQANQVDAAARIKRDFRDIYFARTQEQVMDVPEWSFDTFEVPMDSEQARLYREMQDAFVATLPDGNTIVAPNILAQMMRLIQFASNPALIDGPDIHPKWNSAIELLEFEELPAIIWTNFIKTGHMISDTLRKSKYRVGMLVGETLPADRDAIVQNFQSGGLDVIVAHPGVGKFGLTLAEAKTAIYVERSYNGDDYYQSLHRVRHLKMKHSPHIIILLAVDAKIIDGDSVENPTIDHVIHKVLGFKRENAIQITTGLIREVLYG